MKPPIPIYLAVEDDLSEWVLRRLLSERPAGYAVGAVLQRRGAGYLRKNCGAFNNMARACPVLMLTDLDQHDCPPSLIQQWLPHPKHRHFLLRVAVREVEAWLLADQVALAGFLALRGGGRSSDPESLADPKACLLRMAASCPQRNRREALVRRDTGGQLRQGPAYNSTLAAFVNHAWRPEVAALACTSLRRAGAALAWLESDWGRRSCQSAP